MTRACGTCTLCCKVYDVPAAGTVAGQWCKHCQPGRGCAIWADRPDQCRAFDCLWLTQEWLGPEWKPDQAKIVVTIAPDTHFLYFQVDPGSPNAWKREPYYSQIKSWASAGALRGQFALVLINKAATLVLPDKDVPLGVMGPADRLVVTPKPDGSLQFAVQRG